MIRHITFTKITWTGVRQGKCSGCQKYTRRQKQFMQTLNPFNKDPETGRPKTVRQIQTELRLQAREWGADPVFCTSCEQSES